MGHKSQGGAPKDTSGAITVAKWDAAGREGIDIILMRIPTGERLRECSRSPGRSSGAEELGSWASESGVGESVNREGELLPAFTPLPLWQIDFPVPLFHICIHHGPGPSCARVHT